MKEGNAAWQSLADDSEDQEITTQAGRVAHWRAQQRARGLCVECTSPAAPARKYCARHLAALYARNVKYRKKWRAAQRAKATS